MSHLRATVRRTLWRISRAVLYGLAAVLLRRRFSLPVVHPAAAAPTVGQWTAAHWIEGLNRYVALSLVLVPLAILEPVKPVAFYLTAKGHVLSAGAVLVLGEVIKVTLVGQVIEITKPKLESFRWFAWAYSHWEAVMDRLRSIEVWQAVRRQFQIIVARVRRIKAQMEDR